MSYLLTQIFLYMLATFILGLILGWLIWRNSGAEHARELESLRAERNALASERDDFKNKFEVCDRERNSLGAQLESASAAVPAAAVAATAAAGVSQRPAGLDGPRGGIPDKLQEISGIGPQMEALVNSLGFYHFDQIAAWTPGEVAWVDENLEGFKGRVTRDNWISQAKELAARA